MLFAIITFANSILINSHEEKSFLSWMRESNVFYVGDEYHLRLGIFITNSRFVQKFNSQKRTFKVSLNKFACYTPSEYKILLGRFQNSRKQELNNNYEIFKNDIPDFVDWREKGIVNEVKDQGDCSSCWTFGSVQACESAYALTHGTLFSCSEQNLVDCCNTCQGCVGGFEFMALDYILNKQNGFLNSENDYPYTAKDGDKCLFDQTKGINQIKSYIHGKKGDEIYLKELVAQGVCDIAIDATGWAFAMYSSGIYVGEECIPNYMNHAVGLVGYGTEKNVDYWIVRNSFGKNWGEDGYVRMIRNDGNRCNVASDPLQVIA